MKKIFIPYISLLITAVTAVSCDKFLDELPDNRTVLDNDKKIRKILVSAYPQASYALVNELSSDNIDDMGVTNPNTTPFFEEVAYWKPITQTDNDDLKSVFENTYEAIANSNEALQRIEELGNPENLNPEKGEALITRAYNHFILANLFCNHYNTHTSATDLGIPYMTKPERTLSPRYERGTLQEVYEKINADIETALPLIRDEIYEVKKYHFNKKAAYAFAARFNLFYEKWQKAADYATIALGTHLGLRDWAYLNNLPKEPNVVSKYFIEQEVDANYLLTTPASSIGLVFGAYFSGSRFSHCREIANTETIYANNVWGVTSDNVIKYPPFRYSSTNLDKVLHYKQYAGFEVRDRVAQTGFRRSVNVVFSSEETLLVRAEANILLQNYTEALADLNTWSTNFYNKPALTQAQIETFYQGLAYSEAGAPTLKKRLNPKFTIQAGTQENFLHCLLNYRRILTLHEGLRWFDIRRYGIEVVRYIHTPTGRSVADVLRTDDLRRTHQLPVDVITAGITPNPR